MVTNWWISCVRTIVAPLAAGVFFQWVVTALWHDPSFFVLSSCLAVGAFTYYALARVLQEFNPYLGVLLVVATTPHYLVDDDEDPPDPLALSIQRTFIPFAIAWAITLLLRYLFDLGEVTGLVMLCVAIAAFYGGMRWVEERSVAGTRTREVAGVLLGAPLAPHY